MGHWASCRCCCEEKKTPWHEMRSPLRYKSILSHLPARRRPGWATARPAPYISLRLSLSTALHQWPLSYLRCRASTRRPATLAGSVCAHVPRLLRAACTGQSSRCAKLAQVCPQPLRCRFHAEASLEIAWQAAPHNAAVIRRLFSQGRHPRMHEARQNRWRTVQAAQTCAHSKTTSGTCRS